jgi:hypothetical protein
MQSRSSIAARSSRINAYNSAGGFPLVNAASSSAAITVAVLIVPPFVFLLVLSQAALAMPIAQIQRPQMPLAMPANQRR